MRSIFLLLPPLLLPNLFLILGEPISSRDHHYKTRTLSPEAETFLLEHRDTKEPVGFIAVIRHNAKRTLQGECPRRAHRTVVLPRWQGLGLGSRLSDAAAEFFKRRGCTFFGQTVHPTFGAYRDRSPLWQPTRWNHQLNHYKVESWKQRKDNVRIRLRIPKFTYSHEYVYLQHAGRASSLAR